MNRYTIRSFKYGDTDCPMSKLQDLENKIEDGVLVKASDVAREVCCKIEEEIVSALESNYKARAERISNPRIDTADEFVAWIDGKISALRGIEDFIAEIKKKYESEDTK